MEGETRKCRDLPFHQEVELASCKVQEGQPRRNSDHPAEKEPMYPQKTKGMNGKIKNKDPAKGTRIKQPFPYFFAFQLLIVSSLSNYQHNNLKGYMILLLKVDHRFQLDSEQRPLNTAHKWTHAHTSTRMHADTQTKTPPPPPHRL